MTNSISYEEFQEKIHQMIHSAEAFLYWSDSLFDLHEEEFNNCRNSNKKLIKFCNAPVIKSIILHQFLYFKEAIIILHSLLEQKGKPVEISFKHYFNNFKNNKLEKEIDIIRKEYNSYEFDIHRDKLFAHKDADFVGSPILGYSNIAKKEGIKKAFLIVNKLKSIANNCFSFPANNYFYNYHTPGFDVLYKSFKKSLDN